VQSLAKIGVAITLTIRLRLGNQVRNAILVESIGTSEIALVANIRHRDIRSDAFKEEGASGRSIQLK
jgi:hypothetical protein